MANRLSSNLLRRARAWAGQLTKLAKANAPEHLKKYIHSTVEPNGESPTYRIRIMVDNKNPAQKYGSADARAQEYGSGLKASFGQVGWIKILPKNASKLVFPYPADKVFPGTFYDGTNIHTKAVQSPGIAPYNGVGYIRPAVKEIRATLRKELDETIREAIRFDMRGAFKGANQK